MRGGGTGDGLNAFNGALFIYAPIASHTIPSSVTAVTTRKVCYARQRHYRTIKY